MIQYFIRRLLLLIPTFMGITFICFAVTRYVPGGPVEQAVMRYRSAGMGGEGGGSAGTSTSDGQVSREMIEKLKAIYGFDKPFHVAYLIWFRKLVTLDLGESYTFSVPVWHLIRDRLPISMSIGLIGFLMAYMICIPLGIYKAIRHGSGFDMVTSAIVFAGYAIPGWVVGVVLLWLLGGGSFWSVFPLGDLKSQGYGDLSFPGKVADLAWHAALPVFCYMMGSFATLTILMKNSLMENLGQDYVRTAFAKGLDERTVIFKHAVRNSLIPIATGFGHAISLVLAGSYLVEKVFNIHGIGFLGFEAIVSRDYPVVLGLLVIDSVLKLLGNILSDLLYCVIDPRIRFQ